MINREFFEKGLVKRPTCPFCGLLIERPRELTTRRPTEMPLGSCSCGAVYACDETGHNLGSAMIEALVFGCDMHWDLAWDLAPEEDYLEERVEQYDYVNHLIVPGGFLESRKISGVLFFIRMCEDVQELASDGVRRSLEKAVSLKADPATKAARKTILTKEEVEDHVRAFRVDSIVSVAQQDKRILRNLQRLLYSGDELFRRKAAEILGMVSADIARNDPGTVSRLLQQLFSAVEDTAAFTWGAFEAIGEIIKHSAGLFGGYIPRLYGYVADETKRAQVLQVIGNIATSSPELIRESAFHFIPFLCDPDPSVRGYTARLLGDLSVMEAREELEKLREDPHEITFYENGNLERKSVGLVTEQALTRLSRRT